MSEKRRLRSRKVIKGIALVAIIPLFLSACSNSKNENRIFPFFGKSKKSEAILAVPEKKSQPGATTAFNKPNDGNHATGQNYASLSSPSPSGPVISNKTKFSSKTFGVAGSPRVANTIEVRKGGGRYHVGKPYLIRGIRYVPKEDPNYRAVGLASWYGPNFHGRLTANGEVYDQFALSAAHPTMPLPSYAKVTNMENGASVVVRVNDRGPFAKGRIIDLSSRAAQLLGYTKKGVAKVKVEYVGKARMDGLDEEQLLASYYPGQVDLASIPPNLGRSIAVASVDSALVVPQNQRKSLKSYESNKEEQKVSALKVVRPVSLVNGYDAQTAEHVAISKIDELITGDLMEAPEVGMENLATVEIGPFRSKAELFRISEIAANHGTVSVVPLGDNLSFDLQVILPSEDVAKLEEAYLAAK